MDKATQVAVTLARSGVDDATISKVMAALAGTTPTEATAAPSAPIDIIEPQRAPRRGGHGDGQRWFPLLNALRTIVRLRGPLRADVRTLANMCPKELAAAWEGRNTRTPMARGLGVLVGRYARAGKPVCGLRFRLQGHEVVNDLRNVYAIYTVELDGAKAKGA
jgi:hypothetical protein